MGSTFARGYGGQEGLGLGRIALINVGVFHVPIEPIFCFSQEQNWQPSFLLLGIYLFDLMRSDHDAPMSLVPVQRIERSILLIRGQKVMLDSDLAAIYGVTTARLNQQIRRNIHRFPSDFAFILTEKETKSLMLQFATSKSRRGGRRKLPFVFTEHGAIMAASVLNTKIAIVASIQVVRAFVRLREILASHKDLARKLEELEQKYDEQFRVVFEAIRQLMEPPEPEGETRKIGFHLN